MSTPRAPAHLRESTRHWWRQVASAYVLEGHHLKLLTLAAEAWDRRHQAREALAEHGLTFEDRFGQPHARPEVGIERDARLAFARLLRELDLDMEPPSSPSRLPGIPSNRGR